jgi:hypothetical protein
LPGMVRLRRRSAALSVQQAGAVPTLRPVGLAVAIGCSGTGKLDDVVRRLLPRDDLD